MLPSTAVRWHVGFRLRYSVNVKDRERHCEERELLPYVTSQGSFFSQWGLTNQRPWKLKSWNRENKKVNLAFLHTVSQYFIRLKLIFSNKWNKQKNSDRLANVFCRLNPQFWFKEKTTFLLSNSDKVLRDSKYRSATKIKEPDISVAIAVILIVQKRR